MHELQRVLERQIWELASRALGHPEDSALDCLIDRGRVLITLNVSEHSIVGAHGQGRITTGRLNPGERLWVYGRAGKPCFKCGAGILSASESEGRRTYWCPNCQRPREIRQ